MTYTCPKDATHQSTDSDYCSVCGAKIAGVPGGVSALAADIPAPASGISLTAAATAGTGETCPDCGAQRTPGAKFCEVCRYNFETRTSFGATPVPMPAPPPVPPPMPAPFAPLPDPAPGFAPAPMSSLEAAAASAVAPPAETVPAPTVTAVSVQRWEVTARVDPSLYPDPDPQTPCPVGEPDRTFPLDFAENLIGRRSDKRDIHPEIPLNDPGVSHRHAKLLREPDGSFLLLDVGSTNGTELNGIAVQQGVRMPLKDGDQITLGCWTRLTIRSLS